MDVRNRPRGRPRKSRTTSASPPIQSLERALDVLDALSASGGLTLSELATRLGQSASTLYRALSTLEQRQIVEVDHADQTWNIGPASFRLGSSFLRRSGLIERSRPVMRALMESSGETANLAVERNEQILFVNQIETHETIRAFFAPGTQSPMHASGIGKALLSHYPEHRLARFLRRNTLSGYTGQTITNPVHLRAELADARRDGYAFDNEERSLGMRCVAAAVFDQYGEAVAGISVSGPSNRMPLGDIARIGAQVANAGRDLSRRLGALDT